LHVYSYTRARFASFALAETALTLSPLFRASFDRTPIGKPRVIRAKDFHTIAAQLPDKPPKPAFDRDVEQVARCPFHRLCF